eukprot:4127229-Prymnesium_polylepis.2
MAYQSRTSAYLRPSGSDILPHSHWPPPNCAAPPCAEQVHLMLGTKGELLALRLEPMTFGLFSFVC